MALLLLVLSLQSCSTLCDPIDGSPPGSSLTGILQARTMEWVAVSFSNAWKRKVKVKSLSHVLPSATPWTAAHQAPPSMGFSRQEYWSGVPLPSPYKHATIYKIDNTVEHRELYAMFCNYLHGKRIWKRMDICITESTVPPETNTTG